jgi:hypothetical protein
MKRSVSADRRGAPGEEPEPVQLLTSDEQDRVLAELRDSMVLQNRKIRTGFSVLFYFVAAIYFFCLGSFLHEPWSLVHQQRFEFLVSPPALMAYYATSSFVFCFSALVCQVCATLLL